MMDGGFCIARQVLMLSGPAVRPATASGMQPNRLTPASPCDKGSRLCEPRRIAIYGR